MERTGAKRPAGERQAEIRKNRMTGGLFCLLLSLCLALAAPGMRAHANPGYVMDLAGLLSGSEEAELSGRLEEVSERYQCDVAVVTVDSCRGMSVQRYTDYFYYENGYGYGDTSDGIMLLVSIGDRRYHYSTNGAAIDIFTDYGLEIIDGQVVSYLTEGDFAGGFEKFADLAEAFLAEAASGNAYDTDHVYRQPMNAGVRALIAVCIGLAVSAAVMFGLVRQLRSVRVRNQARDYVRPGSFRITRANDLFLYRTVMRTKIERTPTPPPGGHPGGGSMTHASPGGRSGGRSGSF